MAKVLSGFEECFEILKSGSRRFPDRLSGESSQELRGRFFQKLLFGKACGFREDLRKWFPGRVFQKLLFGKNQDYRASARRIIALALRKNIVELQAGLSETFAR